MIAHFAQLLHQSGKAAKTFQLHRQRIELAKQVNINKRAVDGRDHRIGQCNRVTANRRIMPGNVQNDKIGIRADPCNFLRQSRASLVE